MNPGWERSRGEGEGNGYPLQYSCLENSMDRRAWHAPVRRVRRESMTRALTRVLTPGTSSAIKEVITKVHAWLQNYLAKYSFQGYLSVKT